MHNISVDVGDFLSNNYSEAHTFIIKAFQRLDIQLRKRKPIESNCDRILIDVVCNLAKSDDSLEILGHCSSLYIN